MLKYALAAALVLAPFVARADDDKSTATSERGTTSAPITKEEDEPGKGSLAIESDEAGWKRGGFRLGLGMEYGRIEGLRGAPSGRLLGAVLHAGLRLDESWSLLTTFKYSSASANGGISGLRFSGTIDPTWHVTPSLSLAIGFGFGGIVEGRAERPDLAAQATDVSITLPGASPPVPSCSGVGAVGLTRATWTKVIGPRSTFNVEFEMFGQYTACVDRTGNLEPDTATPIVREQYWPHVGGTLGAGFAWR